MGASDSHEKESQVLQVFTTEEKQHIRALYAKIVGNQKSLTEPFLKKYLPAWLPEPPRDAMFHVVCNCQANKHGSHDNKHLSEVHLGGFLAGALKGTYSEKADIVWLLCRIEDGHVKMKQLYQTTYSIIQTYLVLCKSDVPFRTWQSHVNNDDIARMARSLLAVMADKASLEEEDLWSQDQVESWISKCPLFVKFFDRVFNELFPVIAKETFRQPLMPVVTNVDWGKTRTMLDTLSVCYINYHLPMVQQSQWRLLYSNSVHGDSFSQLVNFISGKGPTVMIVKDKQGHMFGAFVTDSWEIKPSFYGTSECFLFSLHPQYGIYTATGYNENFMYLNQGQETLPNGLGLGGQLNYFGLWIDHSFNSGHSKAVPKCTTYGSPQLSSSPEFSVEAVEVWAVGPEKKLHDSDDENEYSKTSILDKDVGARAILEMAGKKQHSDGLRELTEDEAPLTEEMKRKMNTIPKLL